MVMKVIKFFIIIFTLTFFLYIFKILILLIFIIFHPTADSGAFLSGSAPSIYISPGIFFRNSGVYSPAFPPEASGISMLPDRKPSKSSVT